jgi:hypothetical protein
VYADGRPWDNRGVRVVLAVLACIALAAGMVAARASQGTGPDPRPALATAGSAGTPDGVTIPPPAGAAGSGNPQSATVLYLTAQSPLATSGITIQGAQVAADGSFTPGAPSMVGCAAGTCPVTIAPYTAVIVTVG